MLMKDPLFINDSPLGDMSMSIAWYSYGPYK